MILFNLFKVFFLLGLFSFGGGYASMELIRSRVVTDYHWLTDWEYTDIISIAEMTPGPLGINIASFVGTRTAGVAGTLIATLSYILPALVIVLTLSWFYDRYRSLEGVQGVLSGLRPAVVAMIIAAAVQLVGTAWWDGLSHLALENTNWTAVVLSLVLLILLQKKKLGPIQAILASGGCGRSRILVPAPAAPLIVSHQRLEVSSSIRWTPSAPPICTPFRQALQ